MQTDYLRYFVDVATLGSMSAAAKKNFMTPQGVSRSISALEAELGCELFARDSNKVTLTSFGERLLDDAREVLESEARMRRNAGGLRGESLGKRQMTFSCFSSPIFFETPLLYPASALGTALYGKAQFLQRDTAEVVSLLVDASRSGQADTVVAGALGFYDLVAGKGAQMVGALLEAGYEYRPLLRTEDYVLVPAYSPLAGRPSISDSEICSNNLAVTLGDGMERILAKRFGLSGVYAASGDQLFRRRLCRMGEALTLVPGTSLPFGVPEGTAAVPLENPYAIEIGFAAHRKTFEGGVLAEIISRLSEFYEEYLDLGSFVLLDGMLGNSLFAPGMRNPAI